jgi:hypothetical protein
MNLHRREFSKLAAAALGGLFVGTTAGRAEEKEEEKKEDKKTSKKNPLLLDPHICRGLNTCKNKGKKGDKNECAGQGTCHTVAKHTCKGENDCRGQGGCGAHPGENACKGKGDCHVPLKAGAWKKARKRFEAVMKKADKKFGDAPKAS